MGGYTFLFCIYKREVHLEHYGAAEKGTFGKVNMLRLFSKQSARKHNPAVRNVRQVMLVGYIVGRFFIVDAVSSHWLPLVLLRMAWETVIQCSFASGSASCVAVLVACSLGFVN